MRWSVRRSPEFSRMFGKYKRERSLIIALDKKITRLRDNPEAVGAPLAGDLAGKRSTRLVGKFRLVFQIVESERAVYLLGFDHRKQDYKRF